MTDKILVVEDEEIQRDSIAFVLKNEGYKVDQAVDGQDAYEKMSESYYDLVISDIEMPRMKGIELLEKVALSTSNTAFIVITAYGSLDTALKALRSGASDYLLKPINYDDLLIKVKKILEVKKLINEVNIYRREAQRNYDFSNLVGRSKVMTKVFDVIKTVCDKDATVLITGNSGTGKELVAKAIHYNSKRKNKPFLAINCGAISENLIESELFGHKKGAFTGAISDKEGFLKASDGGSLFLDEISEMPFNLQVKLLRVLQEKEITPVGTTYNLPVNVRFIASTNRNLQEEVKKGRFREDLYYRLNIVEINLPSLNDRREDIPLLVDHFINKFRMEMGKTITGIEKDALRALQNFEWRGEVRELENVIERGVIFARKEKIELDDLPLYLQSSSSIEIPEVAGSLDEFIRRVEKQYILKILEENNMDKDQAAVVLNLGLSTLYRKIKEYGIED